MIKIRGTQTTAVAAATGLLAGLLGGGLGAWLLAAQQPSAAEGGSDRVRFQTLAAGELNVDRLSVGQELVVRSRDEDIVFRVVDGSVLVSRSLVAGEVRTHQASASSFVTSRRPTEPIDRQRIATELAATDNGGVLFLRNNDGSTAKGESAAGYALCMGYNESGEPLIYGVDHATDPPRVNIEFAPKTRVATRPDASGPAGTNAARSENPMRR